MAIYVCSFFVTVSCSSAPRTCLRCTQSHEPVQRTATISLPCNHDICRAHLRKLVVNALISRRNSALSCCSRPFPRETLLEVAKPDEIAIVLKEVLTPTSDHYDPFQELAHRAVSPASTEHEGIWTLRNDSGWTVPDNTILSLPQHDGVAENEETAQRNAYYALIDPDFRELRNAQLDERDRFLAYAREQKRNFARYREQSRVDFTTTCEQQQNDLAQAVCARQSNLVRIYDPSTRHTNIITARARPHQARRKTPHRRTRPSHSPRTRKTQLPPRSPPHVRLLSKSHQPIEPTHCNGPRPTRTRATMLA